MLRLAAVAAAMALGWATLELRSMIERNDASVLAMAEARGRTRAQPQAQPQMATLSVWCWVFITQGFGHRDNPLVLLSQKATG
jgi:hypothetical protein